MAINGFTYDKKITEKIGTTSITIKQKIIPNTAKATKYVASWVPQGAKMKPCLPLNNGKGKPGGICVHNTEFVNSSLTTDLAELYVYATWPNCNMGGVVVNYFVHKTSIWQELEELEQGWHASDGAARSFKNRRGTALIGGNLDCISIECVGENVAGNVTTSEDTTAKLCAFLCKKYNLNPDYDIYTHQYFRPTKYCPAYILGHWNNFIAKVKFYLDGASTPTYTAKAVSKTYEALDSMRIRSSMDASNLSNVVALCSKGTKYSVTQEIFDTSNKLTWLRLAKGYSMYRDQNNTVMFKECTAADTTYDGIKYTIKTVSKAYEAVGNPRIRSAPSTNSSVVGTFTKGSKIAATQELYKPNGVLKWIKTSKGYIAVVDTDDKTVLMKVYTVNNTITADGITYKITSTTGCNYKAIGAPRIRSAPSTNSTVLGNCVKTKNYVVLQELYKPNGLLKWVKLATGGYIAVVDTDDTTILMKKA